MVAPKLPRGIWLLLGVLLVVVALAFGDWFRWPLSPLGAWGAPLLSLAVLVIGIVALIVSKPSSSWAPAVALVGGVATAASVPWLAAALWTQSVGSGTPAHSIGDPTDPTEFDSVLAYARRLEYDDTTHRAADERFLIIVDTVTVDTVIARGQVRFRQLPPDSVRVRRLVGPKARIVPERWAYGNSIEDLGSGRGKGRIVARVYIDTAYTAPNGTKGYPYLKLPPGISYLWVDQLDSDTLVARLVIIPETAQLGIRVDTLQYRPNRRGWQRFSRASWVFDMRTDPDGYNLTCPQGCCEKRD